MCEFCGGGRYVLALVRRAVDAAQGADEPLEDVETAVEHDVVFVDIQRVVRHPAGGGRGRDCGDSFQSSICRLVSECAGSRT